MSSRRIDKEIINYLIFHELLHQNGYWDHGSIFRSLEWQYPDAARLDSIMDSMALDYNLDSLYDKAVWNEIPNFDINPLNEIEDESNPPKLFENNKESETPNEAQSGYKYCRNCGNKLPQSAKFCDQCGQNVEY